ncbi:MAG: hypothetical protein JRJ54_12140 [Deltaproteobacteria bacterium]|nr:hypothetical protein [Deltaproteobacteria bacterium]
MKKILHILRSDPTQMVKELMDAFAEDYEADEYPLYGTDVDYSILVKKIFENDKVISWW